VRLYGGRGGLPAVVASGDGGWVHLAPTVAERLSAHGYFVVGLDTKAYLSSFTSGSATLGVADVPGDFKTLVDRAAGGSELRPLLIGVSEGAGLAVLAATSAAVKGSVAGVIALGLPDRTELGWRFRDSLIYLTKSAPNEPGFNAAEIIAGVAPLPLAAIHSTHDEFVPVDEVRHVMERALEPKRLWLIPAQNHRFSGSESRLEQTLLEAIEWIRSAGR
jgi:alpha-beta hydrolase superfamily lysophospholipase